MKEIIICAAIRADDGYIIRGHRHNDAIHTMRGIPRYADSRPPYGDDQGFITSNNRYIDRKEAYRTFVESGAVSVDEDNHPMTSRDELFSEDLY